MSQNHNDRYLCFTLGEEHFAIPLLSVKEVIAPPGVTPVPQTPSYFMGIMNLRGQIISVIDLRSKLSIKPKPNSETAVIICDLNPNSVGILVDSIESVVSLSINEALKKPEIQSSRNTDYISGIIREGDNLVLLLDIVKTLSTGDHQAIAHSQGRAS